jgi:hypothetical protein
VRLSQHSDALSAVDEKMLEVLEGVYNDEDDDDWLSGSDLDLLASALARQTSASAARDARHTLASADAEPAPVTTDLVDAVLIGDRGVNGAGRWRRGVACR